MAEDILNKLVVEHNFDIAYSEDAELGHAFSIPFECVIGKRNIPVIPFFTNVYVPPLPTAKRCEALGKALGADRQGTQGAGRHHRERRHVALPGHDEVPASGIRFRSLARLAVRGRQHRRAAGHDAARSSTRSATPELLSWAVMFGAIGAHQGELIDYIPTWHHGLGIMRFLPERAHKKSDHRRESRRLASSRTRASCSTSTRRQRATASTSCCSSRATARTCATASSTTSTSVAKEYNLHGKQRTAAEEMVNVGKGGKVSEHVGPLVEAGAHPLQALMALHVIFSTSHARGQQAMAEEAGK